MLLQIGWHCGMVEKARELMPEILELESWL